MADCDGDGGCGDDGDENGDGYGDGDGVKIMFLNNRHKTRVLERGRWTLCGAAWRCVALCGVLIENTLGVTDLCHLDVCS